MRSHAERGSEKYHAINNSVSIFRAERRAGCNPCRKFDASRKSHFKKDAENSIKIFVSNNTKPRGLESAYMAIISCRGFYQPAPHN